MVGNSSDRGLRERRLTRKRQRQALNFGVGNNAAKPRKFTPRGFKPTRSKASGSRFTASLRFRDIFETDLRDLFKSPVLWVIAHAYKSKLVGFVITIP